MVADNACQLSYNSYKILRQWMELLLAVMTITRNMKTIFPR
jgi:hypothetical protein